MVNQDNEIKNIEKIIKRGQVRHDKIAPALQDAGLEHIDPDDISELVRRHKYGSGGWTRGKAAKGLKSVLDKIGSYVSIILFAAIVAEIVAAQRFADSIIGEKLEGFGDHLLYWLGIKKIEVSGPEMLEAMAKVGMATPVIVRGMIIGAVFGYILWKIATKLISYLLRKRHRVKDIEKLLNKYQTGAGDQEEQVVI
jgi:hypothetical protein